MRCTFLALAVSGRKREGEGREEENQCARCALSLAASRHRLLLSNNDARANPFHDWTERRDIRQAPFTSRFSADSRIERKRKAIISSQRKAAHSRELSRRNRKTVRSSQFYIHARISSPLFPPLSGFTNSRTSRAHRSLL